MRRLRTGFTLIETMVALGLLGVIVIAVLSAFSSAALAGSRHAVDTTLDRLARSDAEFIKRQGYIRKPPPAATYANLAAPGYVFAVQVVYYSPGPVPPQGFSAANPERGLQQIVLTVRGPAGTSEKLIFFKEEP
ncbi:MAG TPA: prepilin-type N-terminal cleavage/methylation domain-containing protein [Candidatus Dormibacteraeota bacterium]|nr:prepilin-type N-terminal cleavage/methylation domain-containing protein [Candidatus Dormibacteraeota bacterium]